MGIQVQEDTTIQGLLALAIGLSELIKDALRFQSLQQLKAKGLNDRDIGRWTDTLMELDAALDRLRADESNAVLTLAPPRSQFDRMIDTLVFIATHPDYASRKELAGVRPTRARSSNPVP